jgi:predicted PurR-regulated permease PerM
VNELSLARAIFRGGAFLLALVALALLGMELKWVVVQVFAAAIVAAGMAPVVGRLTDPRRTETCRWRPPVVLVVLAIYAVVGCVVLVLGSLLLDIVLTQGGVLVARVPEFALKLQDAYLNVVGPETGVLATIFTLAWSQIENNVLVPRAGWGMQSSSTRWSCSWRS